MIKSLKYTTVTLDKQKALKYVLQSIRTVLF